MNSTNANPTAAALAAARTAGFAPSIHNTQPWHWRIVHDALQLRADRTRQLGVTDPIGRLLTVSCGAALHHALVALAAEGWQAQTRLVPDGSDPDLLATVRLAGQGAADPVSMRLVQMFSVRRSDRRPVAEAVVPPSDLAALADVVDSKGVRLHLLRPDDVIELASAAGRAQEVETTDDSWRDELEYWVGSRAEGLGVPSPSIPDRAPETTVPGRDFGRSGSLAVGAGHDAMAVYAIIYGDEDTTEEWLKTGEALSAMWIDALERGLTVLPLSAAVEVPQTRQALRRLLGGVGEPYLVLRIGVGHADEAGPAHSPRLPAEQVIEVAD